MVEFKKPFENAVFKRGINNLDTQIELRIQILLRNLKGKFPFTFAFPFSPLLSFSLFWCLVFDISF